MVSLQASDIHNEFMKAIDACNVRFDAAKVILFVLMFALVITCCLQGNLVVISQNDHTQKKATMLQDMHYR